MEASSKVHVIEVANDGFGRPPNCKGNACGSVELRPNYWPGASDLFSFSARNTNSKSIAVTIWWGTALGGCGTGTSEIIFPGEVIEIFTPNRLILGYCTLTVNLASKEQEDEWLAMGAQCSFGGDWYNDGETTCINDTDHRCRNGRWVRLGTSDYCRR